MIGIHTGGFLPARDTENVIAAVERLGIEYPVVIDERLELWDFYGNEGWPARYLWDQRGALYSLHYGEGAYQETEREIQALLGIERELVAPLRPEDARGRPAPGADGGPARRVLRPVRGGRRRGRCSRARARCVANGRAFARRRARLPPARRARPPHRRASSTSGSAPA